MWRLLQKGLLLVEFAIANITSIIIAHTQGYGSEQTLQHHDGEFAQAKPVIFSSKSRDVKEPIILNDSKSAFSITRATWEQIRSGRQ